MLVCNFLIPFPILAIRRLRTLTGIFISSVLVLVGMWLERFLIIVPTLVHPYLPYNHWFYKPSWVEVTIATGTFGLFALFYLLFAKLSPIISIWEVKEGRLSAPQR
jgi:Ni/Fe-hydrogenase subunit HybB-like protein